MTDQPTFKQVVTQVFQTQPPMSMAAKEGRIPDPPILTNASELVYLPNDEDIPAIDSQYLTDISLFSQLYLIGKILGESMPLKAILSNCMNNSKFAREGSMVDMGNGFTLVKFTNYCSRILEGQPWFVGGQIYSLQHWKPNFGPVKGKSYLCFALPSVTTFSS